MQDSKLVLLLFILLAFIFPEPAQAMPWLIFPAVIISMTLNLYGARFHKLGRENLRLVLKLLTTNYVILGGLLAILAFIFVENTDWRLGMILLAIAPPAISIIPISHFFKADTDDASLAEFVGYVIAVILVPVVTIAVLGTRINPFAVIQVIISLLLLPLVFSKILSAVNVKHMDRWNNLMHGIIVYVLIGLNVDNLVNNFSAISPLLSIFLLLTFVLGAGYYVFLTHRDHKEEIDIVYSLFATMKNTGVAGVLAITLFTPEATLPIAVLLLITPFSIAFLQVVMHHHHMHVRDNKYGHSKHAQLKKT